MEIRLLLIPDAIERDSAGKLEDMSKVDVRLRIDLLFLVLEEPNMSLPLVLFDWLRLERLPVPKRFRESASRLSMEGRKRCVVEDGVFGAEPAEVLNLKIPYR